MEEQELLLLLFTFIGAHRREDFTDMTHIHQQMTNTETWMEEFKMRSGVTDEVSRQQTGIFGKEEMG